MIRPLLLVPYLKLLTLKHFSILTRPFGQRKTNICSPKIPDLQPNLPQIPQQLVGTMLRRDSNKLHRSSENSTNAASTDRRNCKSVLVIRLRLNANYFPSMSTLQINLVRKLADCELEMGFTFAAGLHADFVSCQVQIDDLEGPPYTPGEGVYENGGCSATQVLYPWHLSSTPKPKQELKRKKSRRGDDVRKPC